MNTVEIITVFKSAGWSGVLHRNINNALNQKDNNRPLWCGYKNQLRRIHPETCKWHREQNDPECIKQKCEYAF